MNIVLDQKFVALSGSTEEKVIEFITDLNTLLQMGLWWSDTCEILFALKDYGFDMLSDTWNQFLDCCCGHPSVTTSNKTLTERPIFY